MRRVQHGGDTSEIDACIAACSSSAHPSSTETRAHLGTIELQALVFVLEHGHVADERIEVIACHALRDGLETLTKLVAQGAKATIPFIAHGEFSWHGVTGGRRANVLTVQSGFGRWFAEERNAGSTYRPLTFRCVLLPRELSHHPIEVALAPFALASPQTPTYFIFENGQPARSEVASCRKFHSHLTAEEEGASAPKTIFLAVRGIDLP